MITHTSGSYPSILQGDITFNVGGSGNYTVGETVTGSGGFSAKVVKWVAATRKLTVKKIVGNPTGVITGSSSSAAWTTATITQATVGGVAVNTGGWTLRETNHGITRSKAAGSRTLVEVMLAQSQLSATRVDFATPATFTLTGGAWSAPTTYDISNGDVITFTIVSSEPARLPIGTTYAFAITGVGAKTATLSASDLLTHTFTYPVAAGDTAGTAFTITTGNFNLNGRTAYEVADDGSSKALTAPVAVGGTLASKTGVTIQA
jgi:hypothetical protein